MASSRTMPQPLSVIWMSFLPPLQRETDPRSTGVERVLQQFFHDRCGTLDDLAGSDLVGNVVRRGRESCPWSVVSGWCYVVSVTEIAVEWLAPKVMSAAPTSPKAPRAKTVAPDS